MNILGQIKILSGKQYVIASSLWKDSENTIPVIDTEGVSVLLEEDGTTWQYITNMSECWEQIETDIDERVRNSFYPFIMSVNNSIYNDFVNCCLSKFYNDVTVTKNSENENYLDIDIKEPTELRAGDFVYIVSCSNKYLTMVKNVDDTIITVDNAGLNMRFKESRNYLGILFISFPPDYFQGVLDMFAYDLFKREDKEKRQERLGNYTYTNFDPISYYGAGAYPKELQDAIQYWQYIYL